MCHFKGGACAVAPMQTAAAGAAGTLPPAAAAGNGAVLPAAGAAPPPGEGPLAPVLASLVGQNVAVLTGGTIHCGKLIQSSPVTLVGHEGKVTVIGSPVDSVQF